MFVLDPKQRAVEVHSAITVVQSAYTYRLRVTLPPPGPSAVYRTVLCSDRALEERHHVRVLIDRVLDRHNLLEES